MGFLDGIFGFLGGVGSVQAAIFSVLQYLFNLIVYVAQALFEFQVGTQQFNLAEFSKIGKFLRNLWDGVTKLILLRVLVKLRALSDWIEARLRPIIEFLKRVRALYDKLFLTYIKPILNALQHVRQVLAVLRALHINIGVELDAWISKVEQRIAGTFLQIRAVLNNAVDLLNLVSDPSLLLRKPHLLLSLRRILPAIIRAVTGLPPGFFFPSPRGAAGGHFAPVPENFNPRDPAMNPPASFYLGGQDGIGNVPSLSLLSVPQDSAVDDVDMLDFFMDDLYPESPCTDGVACLAQACNVLSHT